MQQLWRVSACGSQGGAGGRGREGRGQGDNPPARAASCSRGGSPHCPIRCTAALQLLTISLSDLPTCAECGSTVALGHSLLGARSEEAKTEQSSEEGAEPNR